MTGCGGTLSGTTYTTGAITADCAISATFRQGLFSLTVEPGTGDGHYVAGRIVGIAADLPPNGMVFEQWNGDIATLINTRLPNTSLTMPTRSIAVTVSYRDKPVERIALTVNAGSDSGEYEAGQIVSVTASVSLSAVYRDRPSETFPLTIGTVELGAAQVAAGVQASVARGLMAALRADNEKVAGSWVELETPPTRNSLVFLIWSGQTTNVENPNLPKTRLYMPASAVTVRLRSVPRRFRPVRHGWQWRGAPWPWRVAYHSSQSSVFRVRLRPLGGTDRDPRGSSGVKHYALHAGL